MASESVKSLEWESFPGCMICVHVSKSGSKTIDRKEEMKWEKEKRKEKKKTGKEKKLVSLQEEKIVLMTLLLLFFYSSSTLLLPDTGSHIIQDKKKRNKKKTQTMKPSKSIYLNLANHQVWGQFAEPSSLLLLILELVWSTWDVSVFLSRK